jgi:DNA-binding NarL/FixJ family response regulator
LTAEKEKTTTLLVSVPGNMQDGLQAMLRSLPHIDVVAVASGGLSAYDLLQDNIVDLMVIDTNLPQEEVLALLHRVKENYPQIRCIVLTLTYKENAVFLASGADVILNRDSSHLQFASAVQSA